MRWMDMRRTGAVEALAGGAELGGIGNKMANSIEKSKALQKVYLPKRAANVRPIEEARKRGRKVFGENGQERKVGNRPLGELEKQDIK
jgi:hypothetical protein